MTFEIKINDKLSLKMPTMEDSQEIYKVVDKDRNHLKKWLAWVDKTTSVKNIEDNTTERIEKFAKKEAASFYARYEDKWIASVGFISIDDTNKRGEIGYWLSSEFEGRGLMTECVKASINYGFNDLGLHRILIRCSVNNLKSAAIPKRLGFILEGTSREDHKTEDDFEDTFMWSILEGEWKE